jgi:uncharacterized protein YjbI with pentapeptide repeats
LGLAWVSFCGFFSIAILWQFPNPGEKTENTEKYEKHGIAACLEEQHILPYCMMKMANDVSHPHLRRVAAYPAKLLRSFRIPTDAEFVKADVSQKPANWTGDEKKRTEELELVKGAKLSGKNLRFANARSAFFAKANLANADLVGARLDGADLGDAHLNYAFLVCANLPKVNLKVSVLQNANLSGADLSDANMEEADLQGATLRGALLTGANLIGAHLHDAHLRDAPFCATALSGNQPTPTDLSGANLTDADLTGAHLTGAHLDGANLTGADLEGAHFNDAIFYSAKLGDANLTNAHLTGATLYGADLTGADLTGAHLKNAYLGSASLKYADLRESKGLNVKEILSAHDWQLALFDDPLVTKLSLPPDHNTSILSEMHKQGYGSYVEPELAPKIRIVLTEKSNIADATIADALMSQCLKVTITADPQRANYRLDAMEQLANGRQLATKDRYQLTLFGENGDAIFSAQASTLNEALTKICGSIGRAKD